MLSSSKNPASAVSDSSRKLIASVIEQVPRSHFVAEDSHFSHMVVGRSMPSQEVARRMLELLEFAPGMRVLHIGAGSGYVAALLAQVAREVISVERVPLLADIARRNLAKLKVSNVEIVERDGAFGVPERAPFDRILVSTNSLKSTEHLLPQLKIGGCLVALEGMDRRKQSLFCVTRTGEDAYSRADYGSLNFSQEVGEILVEMGVIDPDDLERARSLASEHGSDAAEELRHLVRVEDRDLYRALARQKGMRFGDVEKLLSVMDTSLFERVPRAFLDHNHLIPLQVHAGVLQVATTDPDAPIEDLHKVFRNHEIELYLVTPTDFRRLWATLDLWSSGVGPSPAEIVAKQPEDDLLARTDAEFEAHLVALFQSLVLDAIGESASDIHLERYGERVRVRLRVDGELNDIERYQLTPKELAGLINVIKVRADLDITERRLPQGGRIRLRAGGAAYDLRVQTQPSLHGEHAVLRLLPQTAKLISIEDLGFSASTARQYERLIDNPAGLVLVVGPTGSGKSTTLYAGLKRLAEDGRRKVITVEDPIEYSIENIQQTRVRPDIGFCFSDAMRSFVRQDPDVILVGEIRDAETALEAMRASQTGHLVLSTLHCNDAIDAVQRLYDLGIHPNTIAGELLAVIAQRLAKRICDRCREEIDPDPKIVAELFPGGVPGSFRSYRGKGCPRCKGRGTHGRVAVIEYLAVNTAVRIAISKQPAVDELRQLALDTGLVTMRDSAIDHVTQGIIPLSELPRILPEERMALEGRH